MNQDKSVFPMCGLALSGLLATGCVFDVRDDFRPRPAVGSMAVEWTVSRRSDARACARFGGRQGADFELIVYRGSREVAREYARCEDFSMTVDLPPDEYRAIATLVERGDERPVTTTLNLENLRVVRGAQLNIDVDFPSTSFL
ncbi:MAG TPA: hypothetical protein VL242_31030 [Sorangium sp.]|nr:hypothetical protein [Sorangium sp.]